MPFLYFRSTALLCAQLVEKKDVDRRRKKSRDRVGVFMGVVGVKVDKRKVSGFWYGIGIDLEVV